jgi:Raf kinase inhibitor-like YbhB/YbcL family protein
LTPPPLDAGADTQTAVDAAFDAAARDASAADAARDASIGVDAANDAQADARDAAVDASRLPMALTITGFANAAAIPAVHACNVHQSPALSWTAGPAATGSYAVVMIDKTRAGSGDDVHWVAWDILPSTTSLAAGFPRASGFGGIPTQQVNSFDGLPGYFGPCPPPGGGPHVYEFQVYAIPTATLGINAAVTNKQSVYAAVKSAAVESSNIWSGTYAQ